MASGHVDLELARKVLADEAAAIAALSEQVGDQFACAAEAVFACSGQVVLTGIGKAGIIARKISATLASTGTQSSFLHPVEALHGDLGRVQRGDVVVILSHSGNTEEIVRLLDHLKGRGSTLIALTGSADTPLGAAADFTICYGAVQEACPMGLAPTVSTSCMLALGDALALTVMEMRAFTPEDFAVFHPAGDLGRRLLKVEEVMTFRSSAEFPAFSEKLTLGEALAAGEKHPRRAGVILLVDDAGKLSGIITDGDLRRLIVKRRGENIFDKPVSEFMTRGAHCISTGDLASEALALLNQYRIDELPVVDAAGRPVGIIDVQDLLGIKTVSDGDD